MVCVSVCAAGRLLPWLSASVQRAHKRGGGAPSGGQSAVVFGWTRHVWHRCVPCWLGIPLSLCIVSPQHCCTTTPFWLHSQGMHVLVRLIKLSSPAETAFIAEQVRSQQAVACSSRAAAAGCTACLQGTAVQVPGACIECRCFQATQTAAVLWLNHGCTLWSWPMQVTHDLADMVTSKGGALVVCTLVDRLVSGPICSRWLHDC